MNTPEVAVRSMDNYIDKTYSLCAAVQNLNHITPQDIITTAQCCCTLFAREVLEAVATPTDVVGVADVGCGVECGVDVVVCVVFNIDVELYCV
jgi:hypothetical protein